jgi:hypothetical protein
MRKYRTSQKIIDSSYTKKTKEWSQLLLYSFKRNAVNADLQTLYQLQLQA